MTLSPEIHVLGLVLVFFAVAYFIILPRLSGLNARKLRNIDLAMSLVLLGIAGSVYFGTNTSFTLVFFETWWWIYTMALSLAVETPLALWFCRKHGITWSDLEKW
jgi:hypothetical protein